MIRIDDPTHDQEAGVRDSTQDTTRIDDVRISAVRPLISPALPAERPRSISMVSTTRSAVSRATAIRC